MTNSARIPSRVIFSWSKLSSPDHCVYCTVQQFKRIFFTPSRLGFMPFLQLTTVDFSGYVPFCAFSSFSFCHFEFLSFGAFCHLRRLPLCLMPFCASAVLCVCHFVRLPFCASDVLCVCHFVICRFVCASYMHTLIL